MTRPMTPERIRELMTDEPAPDGSVDPVLARILLRYREAVAEATAEACGDLRAAGIDDPAPILLGRWEPRAHRRQA